MKTLHLFPLYYFQPISCRHEILQYFFDMNKSKPVPLSDLAANFVKSLDIISGAIPIPVSFILTMTSLPLSSSFLCSFKVVDRLIPPSSPFFLA
jgi:hypothetical protein